MKGIISPSETDVVVLCGGRGTRLGTLTEKIPKPLLAIGQGEPFLALLLHHLKGEGFKRFILAVCYQCEKFFEFKKKYINLFPDLEVVVEDAPLGTGGAIKHVLPKLCSRTFVVINGDTYVSEDVNTVLSAHMESDSIFTLLAVKAENVAGGFFNKSGLVVGSDDSLVGCSDRISSGEKWVSAGSYVINRSTVEQWPNGRYDLESVLLDLVVPQKVMVHRSEATLIDIGTPECYEIARGQLSATYRMREE